MSNSQVPERASLEYLKKLAKDRLLELRRTDPAAKLAAAQLAVARDHGFSSWRALKRELEQRQTTKLAPFFAACAEGRLDELRGFLAGDPALARATHPDSPHAGWTGLHAAAQRGRTDAVRLLLEHGADPNAREAGDNTYPLHWAAAEGHLETVRVLLDAGGDVHGVGDVHALDVIGWATVWRAAGEVSRDVVALLVERGARHHVFSALAVGDADLIRKLAEEDPDALARRMSRFEEGKTSLHFAMSRGRYDLLDLLIRLGADLEGEDLNGQTALAAAMLRGDREAMRLLHAAGARQPKPGGPSDFRGGMAKLADSVRKGVPAIDVPDIAATLAWYTSIGFNEVGRWEDDGLVNWGMVAFGKAEIMLGMGGHKGPHDVSLWLYTDRIDDLYRLLKSRQLQAAQAALAGGDQEGIEFEQDIHDPFYGGRQFAIRDLNGYVLYFMQPAKS